MKFCVDSIFLFPKGLLKTKLTIKHCLFDYLIPSTLNWETTIFTEEMGILW